MLEERYKTIIRLLPDIIYRIDNDGYFRYLNDSVSILQYKPEELLGRHFTEIIHPDDRNNVQRSKVLEKFRGKQTGPDLAPKLFDERRTEERATRDLDVRLIPKNWKPDAVKEGGDCIFGKLISVGIYDDIPSNGKEFQGTIGIIRDVSGIKKSEESLMRSEKHYRNLIENSTDIISIIATDGTILFEGPSIQRMLGYDPIERIGESMITFIHDDDRDGFKSAITGEVGTKAVFYHQSKVRSSYGEWRFFEFRGKRIYDGNGVIMCIILNYRDITELKIKENEYLQALEQSRIIFNSAMDAILIIDLEGKIVSANLEATKLYGYTQDEMTRLDCNDISSEECKEIFESLKKHISEAGQYQAEARHIDKKGNIFYADIKGTNILYGGRPHFIAVIRDITQKKIDEETLRESEEKYRLIAENTSDVIWILDLDLKYKYISPAVKLLRGLTPQEAISQKLEEVLTPDSMDRAAKLIADEMENERKGNPEQRVHGKLELEMNRKDGSAVWTEVTFTFLRDSNSAPIAILGITRDISERKAFEEKLKKAKEKAEESEKLKSTFLANISHEIRTPMNSVIGYTDLMFNETLSAKQIEYLNNIKSSGNYLLRLISDILDLSKIESKQLEIERIPCDIKAIFSDVASYARILVAQSMKKIELREFISGKIRRCFFGDSFRILQVMNNLISNAVKFTDDGFIEYGVNVTDDGNLEFYVRDTGIGIPSEYQTMIFEEFQQADSGSRRKYGGTGLGLTISQNLVRLMGGDIHVISSTGDTHGSTFFFIIPYDEVDMTQHDEEPPVDHPKKKKSTKILVAEDNLLNQKLAQVVLEKFGYKVEVAGDGREAISKYKSDPDISIILMDIQMPVLDGLDATKLIREIEKSQDKIFPIPIIALTAHALRSDMEMCLQAGCSDYITKPINQETLKNIIEKYLK